MEREDPRERGRIVHAISIEPACARAVDPALTRVSCRAHPVGISDGKWPFSTGGIRPRAEVRRRDRTAIKRSSALPLALRSAVDKYLIRPSRENHVLESGSLLSASLSFGPPPYMTDMTADR